MAAACGRVNRAPVRDSVVAQRAAPVVATAAAQPAAGSFRGDESVKAESEGRPESVASVTGTAAWSIELDTVDLRRKLTIRIALNTPEATVIELRAADSVAPASGTYGIMLPSTGASHHAGTYRVDMHATEAGRTRYYLGTGVQGDLVTIESPASGVADFSLTGRVNLSGDRYADATPGALLHDYASRRVTGVFVAPPSRGSPPEIVITPALQEKVLRRALDGFAITQSGASNGDGGVDSTTSSPLARSFLESRWGAAASIESITVNGQDSDIRLRGRYVPVTCSMKNGGRVTCP